jgi:hypothetical protein
MKVIILPGVLYMCETWSFLLREKCSLRVFENKVLRRLFAPKREVVVGGWRRLHNEAIHQLYTSQDVIRVIKSRRMRWAAHIACMEEVRNMYKILVGKPGGKRPLGRLRHR